jgi:hypothetical protein
MSHRHLQFTVNHHLVSSSTCKLCKSHWDQPSLMAAAATHNSGLMQHLSNAITLSVTVGLPWATTAKLS